MTTYSWCDVGDAHGNCPEWVEDPDGRMRACGGTTIVKSINGETDWWWPDRQEDITPEMEFPLEFECIKCGAVMEGALYHDQLRDVPDGPFD